MYDMDQQPKKCFCDCGTRIVIDQQLLEERQMWKDKYLCLQRQMAKDIGQIKETIYTQCSALMQTEFQNKQKEHAKLINKKNSEIQQLTSKIISYQTTLKVMNREKQLQNQKLIQLQEQLKQKTNLINLLKTQSIKSQHDWQGKMQEDLAGFRKKLLAQNKEMIQELETENGHLKHKFRDFEKKYNLLIPEVDRLKSVLNDKCSAFELLQEKYERLKREHDKEMGSLVIEKEQIEKTHSSCRAQIIKLNDKVNQMQIQLRNQKKAKNQVKVQPIYIQKPVHVQKIVQKIIPVEKVIKQYLQPQHYRDQALEHEYHKLKLQNDRLLKENSAIETSLDHTVKDYERVVQEYQANIAKYKSERQVLGKRIQELNKELDIVYMVKRVENYQRQPTQPEKLKVYVKNDGVSEYFSNGTMMPKIMTVNSPRTLERSTSRNTFRNKPLSTSQSSKRVIWK